MQLEGPSAVQVSATWTADDDLQSTNLVCAASFRNSVRTGWSMGVLAFATGWATVRYSSLVLAMVTLILAYFSVAYLRNPQRVRRHRSTAHSAQGESTYGIDENGVHWEGEEGSSFSRWSAISAFSQTPYFWRFEVVDGTHLLIPRSKLAPADDAIVAAAMQSLAQKVNGGNA